MQKRSALTAALSGRPDAEAAPTPVLTKKLDPGSFPCIQENEAAPPEQAFETLSLGHATPVGSVPTAGLLPNGSAAVATRTPAVIQKAQMPRRIFALVSAVPQHCIDIIQVVLTGLKQAVLVPLGGL